MNWFFIPRIARPAATFTVTSQAPSSEFRVEARMYTSRPVRLLLGDTDAVNPVWGPGMIPEVARMSTSTVDIASGRAFQATQRGSCTTPLLYMRPSSFIAAV